MQLIIEIYFSNDTDYRLEIIVIFGHGGQEKILISNIWDTYYRMLRSTNLQEDGMLRTGTQQQKIISTLSLIIHIRQEQHVSVE